MEKATTTTIKYYRRPLYHSTTDARRKFNQVRVNFRFHELLYQQVTAVDRQSFGLDHRHNSDDDRTKTKYNNNRNDDRIITSTVPVGFDSDGGGVSGVSGCWNDSVPPPPSFVALLPRTTAIADAAAAATASATV